MSESWEGLDTSEQRTLLKRISATDLARQFGKSANFFEQLNEFFNEVPADTRSSEEDHFPSKALILNARRDLSFFEANFELVDNSVDEWRKNGCKTDLSIRIKYDLELMVGEYEDDAGGMDEADVYKVFIPGQSTNDDYSQPVIGSFGMGAKKAIFRLSDGAKVISCRDEGFSATSSVPEKWEHSPYWRTLDGRCPSIGAGVTRIYFLRLLFPPTLSDLSELVKRLQLTYGPLLREQGKGKRLRISVNDVAVDPLEPIEYSGALGVEPRTYEFSHLFKNLLRTGIDVNLDFRFTCGLLMKLPGQGADREQDWGFDVYGNGRLIQRYLKKEFGFGVKGMSMQVAGAKYIRGELLITGHSIGIPWDTHKREYLEDHEVSYWIKRAIQPRIKDYFTQAGRLAGDKVLRNTELNKPFAGQAPVYKIDPDSGAAVPKEARPSPKLKLTPQAPPAAPPTGARPGDTVVTTGNGDAPSGPAMEELEVPLSESDIAALASRFALTSEDELADAIADCLTAGVAFRLLPEELRAALSIFKVETAGELSEKVKSQLIKRLER